MRLTRVKVSTDHLFTVDRVEAGQESPSFIRVVAV